MNNTPDTGEMTTEQWAALKYPAIDISVAKGPDNKAWFSYAVFCRLAVAMCADDDDTAYARLDNDAAYALLNVVEQFKEVEEFLTACVEILQRAQARGLVLLSRYELEHGEPTEPTSCNGGVSSRQSRTKSSMPATKATSCFCNASRLCG